MVAKGVQAWLPSMARCLTPLEVFLVVLVDMDVLTRCKVAMADLQALVDTPLTVKLGTTEDTSPDASSNSTWASGQPFDAHVLLIRIPFSISNSPNPFPNVDTNSRHRVASVYCITF